jgi:hypothetical protein
VGGDAASGGAGASGGSGGSPSGSSSGGTAGESVGGSAGEGGSGGSVAPGRITIVNESEMVETTTLDVPTLTVTPTPSAGNAIIVGITCMSTADGNTLGDCILPDPGGVTDNQGNVYTRVVQGEPLLSSEQGARSYIFIAENIGAPAGAFVISVDPNGTVPPELQMMVFGAIEVAGLAAPPSFDVYGISLVGGTGDTSTNTTTDLPTAQANELAIGVLSMRSDDTNMLITPEAGWTAHQSNQNGAEGHPPGHAMASFVTTSVAQVSHTWTHDPPTRNVAGVIATFRGALTD